MDGVDRQWEKIEIFGDFEKTQKLNYQEDKKSKFPKSPKIKNKNRHF